MLKGPWVMGERYTICDPYLFTLAQWLEQDGVDPKRIPKVIDHRRRVGERAATKKAIAQEANHLTLRSIAKRYVSKGGSTMTGADPSRRAKARRLLRAKRALFRVRQFDLLGLVCTAGGWTRSCGSIAQTIESIVIS